MLDHVGLSVADLDRARAFYAAALAPLGGGVVMEVSAVESGGHPSIGFGMGVSEGASKGVFKPEFWLFTAPVRTQYLHVAFTAPDRAAVDAFHAAALAAGGRDNGAPGLRPHYHPHYYAAFVLDPEGVNVEAVCHKPA